MVFKSADQSQQGTKKKKKRKRTGSQQRETGQGGLMKKGTGNILRLIPRAAGSKWLTQRLL